MNSQGGWTASNPFTSERIGAVAIYCSDGRFGEAFDEFLHERLGLPHYDRLAVPGGAAPLAGHISAYREQEALVEQLRFLVEAHGLKRVVLIAHRNCGFYLKKLHCGEAGLRAKQEADLTKAAGVIQGMSRQLAVEAYFASVDDSAVLLEPVAIEAAADRYAGS